MKRDENKDFYEIKMPNGSIKVIPKKEWIEQGKPDKVLANEMSDIGKLTHLFWGYNIIDKDGKILRKFKFLSKYPNEAKRIIDDVYAKFHTYNKEQEKAYRDNYLKDKVHSLTGFNIIRTSELR